MGSAIAARPDRGLSEFHPVRIRKAPEEVVAALIDAIRAGYYLPGDLLPRERDLAARLGVSRVVLREAIELMRGEGILVSRRGRTGGWVVDSLENVPRVQAGLRGERIASVRAILEARRALELTTSLLVGRRASEADFEVLQQQCVDLEVASASERSHTELWNVDTLFHRTAAAMSQNGALAAAFASVMDEVFLLREFLPVGHVAMDAAVENQWDLLNALRSRDDERVLDAVDRHLAAL
jgi:GntR family transcriptional regulator, transcriptional repressor for pyruvate dehydrogenase complex